MTKRRRDGEVPYENKMLYSDKEPLSVNSGELCPICRDKLLDNFTIVNNGAVWNMGTERPIYDNDGKQLGIEKPDVIYMMLCCGRGFHRKCIQEWLKKKTNCPLCKTDLRYRLQRKEPVCRVAEVVKSKKITLVGAIKFKLLKF